MSNDKVDNFKKLEELLKFNPSSTPNATAEVMKEVLEEELEARNLKAKGMAKETLQKAFGIHSDVKKAKNQFDGLWNKHNKEMGKLVKSLERMMEGQSSVEPEPEGGE